MLEREFQYYLDHQKELLNQYEGRFLVVVGEKVVGNYTNHEDALLESAGKYPMGTFLIQKCTQGREDYSVTFHSRVALA
jgi:hypothetical protein